jgi:hypothetical protein
MPVAYIYGLMAAIIVLTLDLIVKYFGSRAGSCSNKPLDGLVDSFRMSTILGGIVAILTGNLPDIERGLGALYSVAKGAPEFALLAGAAGAREAVDRLDNPVVRRIFSDYLKSETEQYNKALARVQNQKAEISHDNAMRFGESAFEAARTSVDATSFVAPATWWLNREGKTYLVNNETAIKRGVRIRRIFIYKDKGE